MSKGWTFTNYMNSFFKIPPGFEPVTAIALGYLGDSQTLLENLRTRELTPRIRNPLTELVFSGEWGQTSDLVIG